MTTITPIETGSQANVNRRPRSGTGRPKRSAACLYAHYRRLQLQTAQAGRIKQSWVYAMKARQVTEESLRDAYAKTTSAAGVS